MQLILFLDKDGDDGERGDHQVHVKLFAYLRLIEKWWSVKITLKFFECFLALVGPLEVFWLL